MQLVAAALTVGALACAAENLADWNQPGEISPGGWAKARLIQVDSLTQVYISFDRGRCGSGSVPTFRAHPRIALTWRDSVTLEVAVPPDLPLQPAPGSHELDHRVQCYARFVNVTIRRA